MKQYFDNNALKEINRNINLNNYSKALLLSNEYMTQYPLDNLGPIYKARVLALLGHVDEAMETFDSLPLTRFHNDEAYIMAYTCYGETLLSLGRKEEAYEAFQNAISRESSSTAVALKARSSLIDMYTHDKRFDDAFAAIDIERLDRDIVNFKKSYIYYSMKDYKNCIAYGNKVSESCDNKIRLLNKLNVGRSYYYLGDYEKAKELLNESISKKTINYYSAINKLGLIAYYQRQYELALNYANQLITNDETRNVGYELYAKIYLQLGKTNEAKDAIDHIDNRTVYLYYSVIYYYAIGNYEEALKIAPFALSCMSGNKFKSLLRTYIYIYLRLGKFDEAEYIFNCLKEDIDEPSIKIIRSFIDVNKGIIKDDETMYSVKQVYNYDEEAAIRHILSHHLLGDSAKFFDKQSIRDILYEVKAKIQNIDNPISDSMHDRYTIHYNSVGYDDKGILNTIQVITNPGTSDIITLYPLSGADVYEDEEVRKPKEIKRMSQVDKFYKRYGNK